MASNEDRMIDEAEGMSPKSPPPAAREVGDYSSLSQAERAQLARVVAANMGGRGADVARVLNAMNTNPNFAMQQLQRHGGSIGLGVAEASRMSPEREGMDYVDPSSLQAPQQAPAPKGPNNAPSRPAPANARPVSANAEGTVSAPTAQAEGGGGLGAVGTMAAVGGGAAALYGIVRLFKSRGAPPEVVAQELARRGAPPEVANQIISVEYQDVTPTRRLPPPMTDGAPAGPIGPDAPPSNSGAAAQPPRQWVDQKGRPIGQGDWPPGTEQWAEQPKQQSGVASKPPSPEDVMIDEATKEDKPTPKAQSSKGEAGEKREKTEKSDNTKGAKSNVTDPKDPLDLPAFLDRSLSEEERAELMRKKDFKSTKVRKPDKVKIKPKL